VNPDTDPKQCKPSSVSNAKQDSSAFNLQGSADYKRSVVNLLQEYYGLAEPKVTASGQVPLRVEIERRKRAFAATNVEDLMISEGISPSYIIEATADRAQFHLGVFDDVDFITRTWVELQELADIHSLALEVPCRCLDVHSQKYFSTTVISLDLEADVPGGKFCVRGKNEDLVYVPFSWVLYEAESPFWYVKRLCHAKKLRDDVFQFLTYNFYLDCMPIDGMQALAPEQLFRVMQLAANSKRLKERSVDTTTIIDELNFEYMRCMNRIVFESERAKAVMDGSHFITETVPAPSLKVGGNVLISDVPSYDWAQQFCTFCFSCFLTCGDLILCLVKVRAECQKISSLKLLAQISSKTIKLEEFENTQSQSISLGVQTLKEGWLTSMKNGVRNSLREVGKGWFNLEESKREVYEISKLKKFFTMLNFVMQDSLRTLTIDSLRTFQHSIAMAFCYDVSIQSPAKVVNAALIEGSTKWPVFSAELSWDANSKTFSINVDLAHLESTVMKVFDRAVSSVSDIPQLEPMIMSQFFWSSTTFLSAANAGDSEVEEIRREILSILKSSHQNLGEYLKQFQPYIDVLTMSDAAFLESKQEEIASVAKLRSTLSQLQKIAASIKQDIPQMIQIGPFSVSCEGARRAIHEAFSRQLSLMTAEITDSVAKSQDKILEQYNELSARMQKKNSNIEEVDESKKFLEEKVQKSAIDITNALKPLFANYELLDEYNIDMPKDELAKKWLAYSVPLKLFREKTNADQEIRNETMLLQDELMEGQEQLKAEISGAEKSIANIARMNSLDQAPLADAEVKRLESMFKTFAQKVQLYNARETLFDRPLTDYSGIQQTLKAFEPLGVFWTSCATWIKNEKIWNDGPFENLDADTVEKTLTNVSRNAFKSVKYFDGQGNGELKALANEIKSASEGFKAYVPLIQALRQQGMRERHWAAASVELGFDVQPKEGFTLRNAVEELKLMDKLTALTKVGDAAGKEYAIEASLDKMSNEWESMFLVTADYRDTGTSVLKSLDEIFQQLDDHIVMTQAMSFSPFKKPFEDRIATWEQGLKLASEILEAWIACQRSWLYLEPIFGNEDIKKQLPLEAKRFATVDRNWRKYMAEAKKNSHVLSLCSTERMLKTFEDSNKLLDIVAKGLNDYLETKRAAFARFYFLSNDELLSILSQTKDPEAVQPHLKKCFEAIYSVEFRGNKASGYTIHSMKSGEGEVVPFAEALTVKGSVENWLSDVEKMMQRSILLVVRDSCVSYATVPRPEWVLQWQGQVVLAGTQHYWSIEVEEAIKTSGNAGIGNYIQKMLAQLDDLVVLVRKDLSKLNAMTLGALVVVEVHARDVMMRMRDQGVDSAADFSWISQLRYYWVGDEFVVRQVQAEFKYGCEYLGNSPRLVITPLTDRCYITLTGAMHLKLGGAPQGPAGTGKTESVKDLAKALSKQCVVFNCQDGLDYKAMGKFFKGLATAGAWSCFDEFNRIDVEVLSVIAQQITTIQKAQRAGMTRFVFEGSEIGLDSSCSVFITMNPGYAGRTELPDNLKALFRPMAMMVPDYALIAEISLFSFGYTTAKFLSNKIVGTFKLSSEQLSSQDHYDFGMRAVKTVISAAGLLKRAFPDANESTICLRALQDVNRPKFLAEDLQLFEGIITDLFPGTEQPLRDFTKLIDSIKLSLKELELQPVEVFITKCIQLYETTVVRHGLMLVGPSGGGKTCNIRVLQKAFSHLAGTGTFANVQTFLLNPKSVTMGQLYGNFDENTHEWADGVLATLIRVAAADESTDKKWVICDGPVDALWIESMNTVLDDNKKLCLVSGEIVSLSSTMTMMFEVEDLSVASPATVSRCGMIFMEPESIGPMPLFDTWQYSVPKDFQTEIPNLRKWCEILVSPLILFVRRNCIETVPTVDSNLFQSTLKLTTSLLNDFLSQKQNAEKDSDEKINFAELVKGVFVFATIWGIGGSINGASRSKFDAQFRQLAAQTDLHSSMPASGKVYDWKFDTSSYRWIAWIDTCPAFDLSPSTPFAEIIVPTADTIRYSFVIDTLIKNFQHTVCVGPTGTGKSVVINEKLAKGLTDNFLTLMMAFSASTGVNQTQDIIDSKLDKRRKGVFGPPVGKKQVVFVDDLNMPAREVYFAQPPIELFRQWMDHKGWYDRKALVWKDVEDLVILAAMGPPGGGRNPVTPRFLRHFNILAFADLEDSSLKQIFGTILNCWLSNSFSDRKDMASCGPAMTAAAIKVYTTITEELLPTPDKSHYTYNLRDLAKVFQGMMFAATTKLPDLRSLRRLWVHECMRVFQDRLTTPDDRKWFKELLEKELKDTLSSSWEETIGDSTVTFCDFVDTSKDPRLYEEVVSMPKIFKTVEDVIDDYNATTSKQMKLVMFQDAIQHIARITRIVKQPGGNALLLGVGGSGRQSLARVAAHLSEFKLACIEIVKGYGKKDWREDVKKILMNCGVQGEKVVFLFSDTQIIYESFMEDMNGILNAGDVPNLYAPDELETIGSAMKPIVQAASMAQTKNNLFSAYLKRVKENLHVVLAMSPIGEAFRKRLRMYPGLVNCCSLDWFSEWPEEALISVASDQFQMIEFEDDALRDNVVKMCTVVHQSVVAESKNYLVQLRRHNHVTPTSYLELLDTYKKLNAKKKKEVGALHNRLSVGLNKLLSTAEKVAIMEQELTDLQPVLVVKGKEVEELIASITVDKADAEETKNACAVEEAAATQKAAATTAIKDSAEKDLAEAIPALEAATQSLKSLNRNDIVEVKSMGSPPAGVKLVMETVCIMMKVPPVKKADDSGKKIDDYWEPSKKTLLADPTKFLESLFSYDKDAIEDGVIKKIDPYIQNPDFTPERISKVSKACTSICLWVCAMFKYYHIARMVEPKRKALAEANADLQITMAKLADAKQRLAVVQKRVAELEANLEASVQEKADLVAKVEKCGVMLTRAGKLVGGLAGERIRWKESVANLSVALKNVVGDCVIASGCVAYMGAFTGVYRTSLYSLWNEEIEKANIPHTPNCKIATVLADPVVIRDWTINGLPSDSLSIENAIITFESRRWTLMIDPETQANKWIKSTEKANNLQVLKLSEKDYLRTLENAVRFGKPVLLENILETLDAALEPLLLKQTFKQSGQEMIQLGDSAVPYHSDFRFFMTTKLRNPYYTPETAVKVTILNFAITQDGLCEQLLLSVVTEERPDLAELKNRLTVQNSLMKKQMEAIESTILKLLSESSGDILEDETLINTLADSKKTSTEIGEKVAEAERASKEIDVASSGYIPMAKRSSTLYFAVADMCNIDPMYQYSLGWFSNLYRVGIRSAEKSDDIETRLQNLMQYFTYSLYVNVCRSLFEIHKLLFSFLMCTRIMVEKDEMDFALFKFFLAGATSQDTQFPNPAPDWVPQNVWIDVSNLAGIAGFEGLDSDFVANPMIFKAMYDSSTPEDVVIDGKWGEVSEMQNLSLLRCIRNDKVLMSIQKVVARNMGQRFIDAVPNNLSTVFADSNCFSAIIFILSPGADPAADFYRFAEEKGVSKKVDSISLGQGQGPLAERTVKEATDKGGWVLLQNCHLATSFMPSLEKMVEGFDPDVVHRDFRLWLTSMPSPIFPVSILQDGVKMTNEPPIGLRTNVKRQYLTFDDKYLAENNKPDAWRQLLFGLCFIHAVVQDRRRFGPLGWNILYEFAQGDLQVCLDQLKLFLNDYEQIPWDVLQFLTAEINYGGRVSDDKDRRLLNTIVSGYINENALNPAFKYSESGIYFAPFSATTQKDYLKYLDSLPINPNPEVFGLHENADITSAQNRTEALLLQLLDLQPRTAGKGKSREEIITDAAKSILAKVPAQLPLIEAQDKYPTNYLESMNTVLVQEVIRYQKLLKEMNSSLKNLIKALKGEVVMSEMLDSLATSLSNNAIPKSWADKAYPSLKPLASWVVDLIERLSFIGKWISDGKPAVFWISGFFFPQAFLTGALQNYARTNKFAIDTISFDYIITPNIDLASVETPESGVYINGLFLEGARFGASGELEDPRPKELFSSMPPIWLKPVKDRQNPTTGIYLCPVYKTLARAGAFACIEQRVFACLTCALIRNPIDHGALHQLRAESGAANEQGAAILDPARVRSLLRPQILNMCIYNEFE
jgi:dynein heavy chain